jgi:thioredoxin-related protein
MNRYGGVTIVLISIFILSCSALAAQGKDSIRVQYIPVAEFDSTRNPAKDVKDAVVEAKRTGKRILLDVGGNWCKWCHYLDSFWERDTEATDFMHSKFIYVKVNYSKGNENKDFLSKYPKVPGYPHFFVLNTNGKLIWSQDTSELESGQGYDHDKILAFLKKWGHKTRHPSANKKPPLSGGLLFFFHSSFI